MDNFWGRTIVSGILIDSDAGSVATTKCASVTISPNTGTAPETVLLSTTESGAHIFYTLEQDFGVDPTHTGDSAIPPTIRIGSSSGVVNTGAATVGTTIIIRALAYKSGKLDSDITEGDYDGKLGGGGGGA